MERIIKEETAKVIKNYIESRGNSILIEHDGMVVLEAKYKIYSFNENDKVRFNLFYDVDSFCNYSVTSSDIELLNRKIMNLEYEIDHIIELKESK